MRRALPYAVLATAWLVILRYAWPGLMTIDSIDQLREARAGFYTDAHPPVMAALWRLLEHVARGPAPMLILQTLAFVGGLFLVVRRALKPLAAAIVTALLTLFPPIFTPLGVIWKDCLMAGFLLIGIGLLLQERRKLHLAGLAVLVLATATRYNAPAATFAPIILLFQWKPMAPLRRYALATAVWLGVTIVGLGIDGVLADQEMHFWYSTNAPMDIAGTLCHLDEPPSDDELREMFRGTDPVVDHDIMKAIRIAYSPLDPGNLVQGPLRIWDMPFSGTTPAPQARRDAMGNLYRKVVFAHPGAYLAHRFAVMRYVLALGGPPSYSTVMMHVLQRPAELRLLGVDPDASHRQARYERRLAWIATHTGVFRPWIYLVLALAMLGFCRGNRDVFALLLSGIGMEASLLLLAVSPDYRYSHWLVICTCSAVVMLIARRSQGSVYHRAREAGAA